MPRTLAYLKTALRNDLAELTEGIWEDGAVYENDSNVDELALALNRAQEAVVDHLFTPENPLLTGFKKIAINLNGYNYAMPTDFLSMLQLRYFNGSRYYTLVKEKIRYLLESFNPTNTSSRPEYYDIEGEVAEVIDEGVVTGATDSKTILDDSNKDFTALADSQGNALKTGLDVVVNLRDDSRAVIDEVTSATRLTTSGLTRGKTNMFQLNDKYQIESGEKVCPLLWVYKPASGGDTEEIVSEQTALTFTLSSEAVLESIDIKLSAAATNPVKVQLEDNASPGSPVVTGDPTAVASISTSAIGYNLAVFDYGIQLNTTTTYLVVVTDGAGASVTPTHIKVNAYTGNEYLEAQYARYARDMVNDTDMCEIPTWAQRALIYYAEHVALKKPGGGRNPLSVSALNDFMNEVERVKREFLTQRHKEQGFGRVHSIWIGGSRVDRENPLSRIKLPVSG